MMIDSQSTAIVVGLPSISYEPEVEEEEAFVTPVARHEPYPTRRPVGRRSKRLEDKIEEQYRSILPRPEASVELPVNVDPLVAQPAIVNPPLPVPEAPIIESKDEILLLGMDWFKRTRARLHVDETTENEEHGTFDEFEYKDEMLNEAEGYFTSEVSDNELFDNPWKDHHSPAVYLSHMEEIPTNEPDLDDESLEVRLKKAPYLQFLGHIVGREGIRPDEGKVEKVQNFTVPQSLRELRVRRNCSPSSLLVAQEHQ
ncbi:5594_t:CDS:2, partial [Cetraspora pellucida]